MQCDVKMSIRAFLGLCFLLWLPAARGLMGVFGDTFSTSVNITGMERRYQKPYRICTSHWLPFVNCSEQADPSHFTGYQIELFRLLAKRIGWNDSDYRFHCMDWTPMISDLLNPNGSCFTAAAGVEVSLDNVRSGLQFSWPIYKSGLMLLTTGSVNVGGLWTFAQAFHWSLWLALGVTGVVAGAILFLAEWLGEDRKNSHIGVLGWAWYAYARLVAVDTKFAPTSWGSRIIVWAYALLVLIVINFFTATSASMLTQIRISSKINGLADLPGKSVVTWTNYVNLISKYGVRAQGLPWERGTDLETMVQQVRSGSAVALVLDSPVVQHIASQDQGCNIFSVGQSFETFSLAMAFAPDFPGSAITSFSTAIVDLQQTEAKLDELEQRFIRRGADACDYTSAQNNNMQIGFFQVAGLWIILGGAAGIGLLLLFIPKFVACCMGPDYNPPHHSMNETEALDQLSAVIASRLSSVVSKSVRRRRSVETDPGHVPLTSEASGNYSRTAMRRVRKPSNLSHMSKPTRSVRVAPGGRGGSSSSSEGDHTRGHLREGSGNISGNMGFHHSLKSPTMSYTATIQDEIVKAFSTSPTLAKMVSSLSDPSQLATILQHTADHMQRNGSIAMFPRLSPSEQGLAGPAKGHDWAGGMLSKDRQGSHAGPGLSSTTTDPGIVGTLEGIRGAREPRSDVVATLSSGPNQPREESRSGTQHPALPTGVGARQSAALQANDGRGPAMQLPRDTGAVQAQAERQVPEELASLGSLTHQFSHSSSLMSGEMGLHSAALPPVACQPGQPLSNPAARASPSTPNPPPATGKAPRSSPSAMLVPVGPRPTSTDAQVGVDHASLEAGRQHTLAPQPGYDSRPASAGLVQQQSATGSSFGEQQQNTAARLSTEALANPLFRPEERLGSSKGT